MWSQSRYQEHENGARNTKTYYRTLIANRGQTFRIGHFENSQTPSSGRNRYDVISAIVKRPITP
jgi:hypothetical protein